MKLIALLVARCASDADAPVFLCSAFELGGYAFYQRHSMKEACKFLARTAIPRVGVETREVIEHDGSVAFLYRFFDSLAVVAIGDANYPSRVAFRLLHEIHEKFTRAVPVALWSSVAPVGNSSCAAQIHFKDDLALLLRRFQDARKADTLTAVMEKSEQTQKEVKRTIDAVLQNGESLDELVQKSQDLSLTSKQLFKTATKAKKHYACCKVQ
ncbi:putative prenylated protein [Toxoplasma gondii GT1]|uniref:Putative prenylated protein n=5 Tax=Toxoplasma gondii TaxID=5811 RepID=S7UMC5_TOXGG|nr:putative prenylated protein [Toxoplasma gondii GT1]KAF4645217.1 putative prenylated protein [Toxoplasma gondii]KFH06804.1 putative prenylated protein [Toxoplasma gondii VAND]PIL98141.1 putative prenylated protein [Toxoplasma gondii COUG]